MSDLFCDSSLNAVQGDSLNLSVSVYGSCDADAEPVGLADIAEVVYTLSKSTGCDAVLTLDLNSGITIPPYDVDDNPDHNQIVISLTSAETQELCGVYSHSCYVINSDGDKTTIFKSDSVVIAK